MITENALQHEWKTSQWLQYKERLQVALQLTHDAMIGDQPLAGLWWGWEMYPDLNCHGVAGMHARELWRHAWEPNDGVRWTSWGQIRECWPKDGGWRASGGQINRQQRGKYVSWMFKTGFGLPSSLAHTGPEHMMQKKSPQLKKQLNRAWMLQ